MTEGRNPAQLADWIRANRATYSDEALTQSLLAAGYTEDAIRVALAGDRVAEAAGPVRRRAIRAIVIAYVAVFALLSVGMLANSRPLGYFMPDDQVGILILGISLGVGFGASMIWVASRWAFGILFFALLTIGTISGVTSFLSYPEYSSPLVFVPPAIGIVGMIWLLRRQPGPRGEVDFAVLLAIPILLLLAVAGICVVSGLPIPGGP